VAGDVAGIEEANTAMDEGRLVGVVIAEKLGRLSSGEANRIKTNLRKRLANLRIGSYGEGREKGKEEIIEHLSV
jgi:hypothetical protein